MKRLIIYNFILRIIGMGLSFVYIPQILKFLGEKNYGIWATVLSILSWINFCDIGIGNSLRTTLVEYIEKKENKLAKQMVSTAYINIGAISIVLFLFLIVSLNFINSSKLLKIEYLNLNNILLISFTFVILNFILSLCKPIYYALQKPYIVSFIEISTQVFNIVGVLIFINLNIDKSLIYIALLYGSGTFLNNLIFSILLFKKYKYLAPSLKEYNRDLNYKIGNLGIKFFILQIVVVILFTTDSVIITRLFGPEEVTPYNIASKLFGTFIVMYGILLTPIWSKITQEKNRKNFKNIRKILKSLQMFYLVVILGIVIMYFIYPYISFLWLKKEIIYPKFLLINIVIYVLLSIWCNNYSCIMNGMGEVNLQVKIAIIQGIVNIPISIYLAKYFGVAGVIMGTNICMAIPAVLFPLKFKINEVEK